MLSLAFVLAPALALSGPPASTGPTDADIKRLIAAKGVDLAHLPTIVVDHDDVAIDRSCTIRIPPGTIIDDDEGDGVVHITADDVFIEFAPGSVLQGRAGIDDWLAHGAKSDEGWDTLTGTGITIDGHQGVRLYNAHIRGYRNGIIATDAPGLSVTDATLSDLYRQRLGSTATREDSGDWLYPHHNDDNQWLTSYGAAIWAERCDGARFEGVKVRRGQNGIILDETDNAVVVKNDCSFLSGWGLAMWRSSHNEIKENRFDFCVRGHVEGVYNRGQDSAGILMFEECTYNTVTRNSCTHSGDGIFGFGGNDAVERATDGPWGNAHNIFVGNDLSFAPAHGFEMTFSENLTVGNNTIEGNAICGVWGGYSQGMSIRGNLFKDNGGMAYGAERGAINIEHGANNTMELNEFVNNKCGIRIWWDDDKALLAQPGVHAKDMGVTGNKAYLNTFVMNSDQPFGDDTRLVGIELQDLDDASDFQGPRVLDDALCVHNTFKIESKNAAETNLTGSVQLQTNCLLPGESGPFGASSPERISPPGREWIICDRWGPWDFESPLVREHSRSVGTDIYEIYIPKNLEKQAHVDMRQGVNEVILDSPGPGEAWKPWLLTINADPREPISSYTATVRVGDGWSREISGRFINAQWSVRCWAWAHDPLVDPDAWRVESESVEPVILDTLDLPFANGGPARVSEKLGIDDRDRFALTASTTIELPKGRWKLTTLSDDGIRVRINGEQVIERWDIHGPTPDQAVFTVADDAPTTIELEYFENDGYATLSVDLRAVE